MGERLAGVYRIVGNGYDDGCGVDRYGKRLGIKCLAVRGTYSKVVGAQMSGVGDPDYDARYGVYRGVRRRLVKAVRYYIVCVCIRCTYGINEYSTWRYDGIYDGWNYRYGIDRYGKRFGIKFLAVACAYSKVVGAQMSGVGGPAYYTRRGVYRGALWALVKAVCYYIVWVCIRCVYGIGEYGTRRYDEIDDRWNYRCGVDRYGKRLGIKCLAVGGAYSKVVGAYMGGVGGPAYYTRCYVYRGARRRLVKAIRYGVSYICIRCVYGIGERLTYIYRTVCDGIDDGCGVDRYGKRHGIKCLAVRGAYSKVVGAYMGGVGGPAYDTGCSVYRGARRRLVKAVRYGVSYIFIRCADGIGERLTYIYRMVGDGIDDGCGVDRYCKRLGVCCIAVSGTYSKVVYAYMGRVSCPAYYTRCSVYRGALWALVKAVRYCIVCVCIRCVYGMGEYSAWKYDEIDDW